MNSACRDTGKRRSAIGPLMIPYTIGRVVQRGDVKDVDHVELLLYCSAKYTI